MSTQIDEILALCDSVFGPASADAALPTDAQMPRRPSAYTYSHFRRAWRAADGLPRP
jgi:hypothetical protein